MPPASAFAPKTLRALILIEGEQDVTPCDAVHFQGRTWLVPMWLEAPSQGLRRPERIILVDELPHQTLPASAGADLLVNRPIPRVVLLGQIPTELRFVFHVEFEPEIFQAVPKGPDTVQ